METNTNTPEAQELASAGCHPTTCSAYENPETDKVWHETLDFCNKRDEYPDPQHVALANLCEKLERQRNEAWKTIKDIRECVIADETFGDTVELIFGKPLEEAEAEIARLNSLLNAQTDAPPNGGCVQ